MHHTIVANGTDFWSGVPILVWGPDMVATKRVYKALSELFPNLDVSQAISRKEALISSKELAPGLVLYIQIGNDDHQINKLALEEANSRNDNVLLITVVQSQDEQKHLIHFLLEDLCNPEKSKSSLEQMWTIFNAGASSRSKN